MSEPETFLDGRVALWCGDSREVLRRLPDASIHAIVTDPPYALVSIRKRFGAANAAPAQHGRDGAYVRASAGFMGQQWDTGETAFAVEFWAEVLRVLKPGGHVVAFSGTRTYHRMACAIEDAGFEIRDQLAWVYGTGFPKSHDVAKGIDKALGAKGTFGAAKSAAHQRYIDKGELRGGRGHDGWQRPWMDDPDAVANAGRRYVPATAQADAFDGWGTALKPSWEPIAFARKPLDGTVAANALAHGPGALNIDACRIEGGSTRRVKRGGENDFPHEDDAWVPRAVEVGSDLGRWPANIVHDGSPEVVAAFPEAPGQQRGVGPQHGPKSAVNVFGDFGPRGYFGPRGDFGSAARFFYSAKADADDRLGSKHPTVKPVDLMQWLCRLVTPPGGTVLDPFAGTGTTGEAAWREGFSAVLVEREAEYQADIRRRMKLAMGGPEERKRESIKARHGHVEAGPLFSGLGAAE